MTETPANKRLQILKAVEDGWNAFAKAPWTFLLFQALVAVIALPFAAMAGVGSARIASFPLFSNVHPVGAGLLLIIGLVGYIIVVLWGVVGIIRGAWKCLEGVKPDFKTFIRWDGEATGRLFIRGIEFLVLLAVISLICRYLESPSIHSRPASTNASSSSFLRARTAPRYKISGIS